VVAIAQSLREQVACACRILALEGYADLTLGHVSGRIPGTPTIYIKRKGIALGEAEPDDVIAFELDDADALDSPEMHLEAVLHTEVYRARPDVGAVVHGHPPHATALSATGASLELLTHDAVLFVDGLPVYDYREGKADYYGFELESDVKFGKDGEWAQSRVLQVQFQNIKGNSIDDIRDLKTEVIIYPPQYKSGEVIYPYENAITN